MNIFCNFNIYHINVSTMRDKMFGLLHYYISAAGEGGVVGDVTPLFKTTSTNHHHCKKCKNCCTDST